MWLSASKLTVLQLALNLEQTCYTMIFVCISGSLLLDSLLSHLTTPERQNCKAVYLHVLTTNSAAMQFYEKRHFMQFRYLPLYYAINGTHKDGFSYVLYINGGEPPWTLAYPFNIFLFLGMVVAKNHLSVNCTG